jgi:branched-chain amino acid transport system substrate-binding protein
MNQKDPAKVGLLFSKAGITSKLESSQLYGALFAIDQINERGGLDGRELTPVHYDPESEPVRYKILLEKLITEDRVNVIFGGYTSTSRKAMLRVAEKHNKLLFYPQQYEGFEFSDNIIYTGAAPNQNSVQLADFMTSKFGARIYMVGSRYIYPYESNRTMQELVLQHPSGAVIGERYLDLQATQEQFDEVVKDIRNKKPDFIFCTVIGHTVPFFYRAYAQAGLDPETMPICSLNTSEAEIAMMGAETGRGHFTSSPYFQSIDSPENSSVLKQFFQSRYGQLTVPNMNWEAAYFAMHFYANAFRAAGGDEIARILPHILGAEYLAPQGRVRIDPVNHHTGLYPRIGRADSNGQFTIVRESRDIVNPDPYMLNHTLGDWTTKLTAVGI